MFIQVGYWNLRDGIVMDFWQFVIWFLGLVNIFKDILIFVENIIIRVMIVIVSMKFYCVL